MIIAAIVVTYFPNEISLERLIRLIYNEVEKVYVIDNTPRGNLIWLTSKWFSKSGFNVIYQSLGDNYGIAKAHNVGIDLAIRDGCDHVIFFDQDSAPQRGMINKLATNELKLLADGIKVGSVGPLFLDEKSMQYAPAVRHTKLMVRKIKVSPNERAPVDADHLIASGSLIRVSILQEVGVMLEELFIDWVDIEWGLRAGRFGCKHFIIPDAVMLHSIGDEFVSIGIKAINLHNDTRNYYIVRNACYLLLDKSINWQWRVCMLSKIPKYVIFYSITTTSGKRMNAFLLLIRACVDGFLGHLGRTL